MATFMNLPRAPLDLGKSAPDRSDNYSQALKIWRDSTRQEATENLRANPEYEHVPDYCKYLQGEFWPRRRPKYRSKFFDNRLAQARIETLSLLTDIRPTIDVASKIEAYKQQAEIAKNIILYEWQTSNLDLELVRLIDHALMGMGYWKIDANFPGQRGHILHITPCGMDEVLPFRPTFNLQEGPGVLYRAFRTLQYLLQKWPLHAEQIKRQSGRSRYMEEPGGQRPNQISQFTWDALNPAIRQFYLNRTAKSDLAPQAQTHPALEVEEYWIDDPSINEYPTEVTVRNPELHESEYNYWYTVQPKARLFPRKRLIVFVGDEVVYDGPSPYWHGLYPFAALTLNPVIWAPGGLSKYRNMVPINQLINKLGAASEDTIERKMNPNMRFKEGAVRPSDFRNYFPDLPGLKLLTTPMSQPGDVAYLESPDVPPSVYAMQQYLMSAFDRHAGTLDPTQLGKKKQVPSADAQAEITDSLQASFRLESRYVEGFLRDAGTQAISHVFQFGDTPFRIWLLGADGITWEDFDYAPGSMVPATEPKEDHWKSFAMRIASGSTHGASQNKAKVLAITLARMNLISKQHLFRTLELPGEQIIKEMQQEQEMGIAPMSGRTPRPATAAKSGRGSGM